MGKIEFKKIKDSSGELVNNLVLRIYGENFKEIKKLLTIRNTSVEWKIRFLNKKKKYWSEIVAIDASEKKTEKAKQKLKEIEEQLEELEPKATEELYTEEEGSLYVPPGLWFLCDSIRNEAHTNTTLKPFYLPGLRSYQIEALQELYKYNRGITELATGLGKSRLDQSIALAGVLSGKRVMIVVPSEYLVGQMCDELKTLHPNTTAQGGGRQATSGWDILVTTVQSAGMFADIPKVVVLDEIHHQAAETWMELMYKMEQAENVYGLTATAFRADGLDMLVHAFSGPVLYKRDVKWGIENKWLNSFIPISIQVTPTYTSGPKKGKPIILSENVMATSAYKILINNTNVLNVAKNRLLACMEKERVPIVIYKTVEACKNFRKFCKDSIDLDIASAQDGKKSKYPLVKFQKGETNVLLANSGLVAEGIDLPRSDSLLQLVQNSSDISTYQMLGRILRLSKDKKQSILMDISVNGYSQFERARDKRNKIYEEIVGKENVKIIKI